MGRSKGEGRRGFQGGGGGGGGNSNHSLVPPTGGIKTRRGKNDIVIQWKMYHTKNPVDERKKKYV